MSNPTVEPESEEKVVFKIHVVDGVEHVESTYGLLELDPGDKEAAIKKGHTIRIVQTRDSTEEEKEIAAEIKKMEQRRNVTIKGKIQ